MQNVSGNNTWFWSAPGNVGSPISFLHMGLYFPVGLSRKVSRCSPLVKWADEVSKGGGGGWGECNSCNSVLTLYFGSLAYIELAPMLNHCNVDQDHNDRLHKMVPWWWYALTASLIMPKYVETEALPDNYDELISFLKWLAIWSTGGQVCYVRMERTVALFLSVLAQEAHGEPQSNSHAHFVRQ